MSDESGRTPAELAQEVAQLAEDFELAKATLIAIVRAKRAGVPNPDAWETAKACVEKWSGDDEDERPPMTFPCPECRQILINAGGKEQPIRVDCGPVHVVYYEDFTAEIESGKATIVQRVRGSQPIVSPVSVFGPADDEENDDDAEIPD